MSDDEQVTRRSGYELPLLLLGAFRSVIDGLHAELARAGHPQARPLHGFALQAIGPGGTTIGELGRRLGVTKQAAARTARSLEEAGYARRAPHPADGRARVLTRTRRGEDMLDRSAEIFGRLRQQWAQQLGDRRLQELEDDVAALAGTAPAAAIAGLPGWLQ